MLRPYSTVLCVFLALPHAAAIAEEPAASEPDTDTVSSPADGGAIPAEQPAETPARLTGDWGGLRSALEAHGVSVDLSLTSIYQHTAHGGLQTKNAHRVSGSYDLELTFDFDALGLWSGGTLYAYADGGWDDGVDEYVGDLFGVNYDAIGDEEIRLYELWYEHSFLEERLRIRFGKLDLRSEFDTNAYANDETAQFLNGGLYNTANLPFPDPGHGIQVVAAPVDWLYVAAGIADADAVLSHTGFDTAWHGPANTFSMFEFGLTPTWESAWGALPGAYRLGMWYDPQPKELFYNDLGGRLTTTPLRTDDVGFYGSFDQLVWREAPEQPADEQGLGLFARYGFAHADVNEIEHFWSVGGQVCGLVPARDEDVLGFGVAQGLLSRELRLTGADPRRETALELYYRIQVTPWLAISPDAQWILRAGGENGPDAFVAGVRVQIAF